MKAASFSFILKAEVPLVFRVETPKQVSISSPALRYKAPDYMNTGPFTLPVAILNHELPSALDLQQAVAAPPVNNRGHRGIAGGMEMLLFQRKPWLGGKWWGFPGGSEVKSLPAMQENCVRSLGWEDPLEKGKTTHSSILAWRIPWTEEPGGLQFTGSQRVRHN